MNTSRRCAADDTHGIDSTASDETLGDALRVRFITTGLWSVWRRGRGPNAAKVHARVNNAMDEIEMPAFLRWQAE